MALDKLVDSTQLNTDLTAIANAIRAKGGTSEQLAFPQGFVDAVEAIETGGGGAMLDAALDGSVTEITTNVTKIVSNGLRSRNRLTKLSAPELLEVEAYGMYGCSALVTFEAKKLERIRDNAFERCRFIAVFPAIAYTLSYAMYNWRGAIADLGGTFSQITNSNFSNATNMSTLILRSAAGVVTLGNTNVFSGSPFASNGSGGTLYVPQALISTYQSATNWSTILGYANNQILPIESSIYENQYADGTPVA